MGFEDHVDQHSSGELRQMQRELKHHTRGVDALAQLVGRVCDCLSFEVELKNQVEALHDKIAQLSKDVGETTELCGALLDEVKAQCESKEAHQSFNISLMVTLLFPLQFLTGVYGMNFQDADGKGVVPLLGMLTLERSYAMFWGLGLVMTLLLA